MTDLSDKIVDAAIGIVMGGAIILFGAWLFNGCASNVINSYRESLSTRQPKVIKEDLNENGLNEAYIEFCGEKYFREIDGKPVEEFLHR